MEIWTLYWEIFWDPTSSEKRGEIICLHSKGIEGIIYWLIQHNEISILQILASYGIDYPWRGAAPVIYCCITNFPETQWITRSVFLRILWVSGAEVDSSFLPGTSKVTHVASFLWAIGWGWKVQMACCVAQSLSTWSLIQQFSPRFMTAWWLVAKRKTSKMRNLTVQDLSMSMLALSLLISHRTKWFTWLSPDSLWEEVTKGHKYWRQSSLGPYI